MARPKPEAPPKPRYFRKVFKIRAVDSPNVRLAEAEIAAGKKPSYATAVPGVLPYDEYLARRAMWDPVRQCIGLDAEFWEGKDALMFPPVWLNAAHDRHDQIIIQRLRQRNGIVGTPAIGCDPAEGGDDCTWAVRDDAGYVRLRAQKTPDTSVIPGITIALMREFNVDPGRVFFDRGGGGKEHADYLNAEGWGVHSIGFGEAASQPDPEPGFIDFPERVDRKETAYAYLNRRAQMYYEFRLQLDPAHNPAGCGIPSDWLELRRQLAPIPLTYDKEGRVFVLPKNPPPGSPDPDKVKTLKKLIGCSPDHADAAVLANHAWLHGGEGVVAGGW